MIEISVIRDSFDWILGIITLISALATAGAFWVTYFTLIEMKKQTELANDPLLKIRIKLIENNLIQSYCSETVSLNQEYYDDKPNLDWKRFITNNLNQDISGLKNELLVLSFKNAGISEISQLSFDITIKVEIDNNGVLPIETKPSIYPSHKDVNIELESKNTVLFTITNVKYFPKYTVEINKLQYTDIRGKRFTKIDGQLDFSRNIPILIPAIPKAVNDDQENPPIDDYPPDWIDDLEIDEPPF